MTSDTYPTTDELVQHRLTAFKGIEAGLGEADPVAMVAQKLEAQHPGHLILVQAGKFLHGYDRTAYALAILKKYRLKLVGTASDPHIRVGFPMGNYKRRLWTVVEEFGIPYVVALGTLESGRTIIQERLRERRYTFGPYKTFTVREKKFRDVVDAPMKDRIVHWMLYRYLLPIWQPRFIHDTYGNLPSRGTHAAVRRLAQFARSERATWVLQLDISKYFYSVNHALLKERALRHIGDHDLRMLLTSLIDSFRTDGSYDHLFDASTLYRQTSAKGMPIGNLTSQLFANIYLNDFDHWMKETLRVKRYVRYVDDMAILGESREELQAICQQITTRLAGEGLTIHPHKIRLAPARAGISFLGYVVWPNHISAGRYVRSRYHQRLRQHESGARDRTDALRSYQAMFKHTGATR